MPPLRSGGVSRMRVAQVVVGRGSWISGGSANSGGRNRSIRADHVTWVRTGAWIPPGDPALQPEQQPHDHRGEHQGRIAGRRGGQSVHSGRGEHRPVDADGCIERSAEEDLLGYAVGQRRRRHERGRALMCVPHDRADGAVEDRHPASDQRRAVEGAEGGHPGDDRRHQRATQLAVGSEHPAEVEGPGGEPPDGPDTGDGRRQPVEAGRTGLRRQGCPEQSRSPHCHPGRHGPAAAEGSVALAVVARHRLGQPLGDPVGRAGQQTAAPTTHERAPRTSSPARRTRAARRRSAALSPSATNTMAS